MKKISFGLLLLISGFGLIPNVSADSVCTQIVTAAVNYRGECQYFSNPCQVPSTMKKVPSCDLVEHEVGLSLEDKAAQRRTTFFRARPAENNQLADKTYNRTYRRYGSGSLTRGNVNRSGRLQERNTRQHSGALGRSTINTKTSGPEQSSIRRTSTYKRVARATGIKRTGLLEDTTKWNVQKERHSSAFPTDFSARNWESNTQTRIKERSERKRADRRMYLESLEKDKLSILKRGGYRHSRVGDLHNYTQREE